MFKNYLKTAWRTISHNKIYSAINILGLTIGLCACMLVATVMLDDLSYDKQWSRSNDLYRIISINKMGDGLYDRSSSSLTGLVTALKNNFPEVEAAAGIRNTDTRLKLDNSDANGIEVTALSADTTVWQMLDLHVLAGNPRQYIAGDNRNLIITESFRKKFFPNEDPVGKTVYSVPVYSDKSNPYIITGVIKNLPVNSVMRAEAIEIHKPSNDELYKKQYGTFSENYILLKPGTNIKQFTAKVNKWYAGFVTVKKPYQHEFQPIQNVYLHSDFSGYQTIKGDYKNIYILSGVAILLLVIACVNFVNLSTARALQRLKETGVRKILGAQRKQLVFQFLMESFLYFLIATALATIIYQVSLPSLEHFIGHKLAQTFTASYHLFLYCYGGVLFVSIITGIYPALVLSAFNPAATIKGELLSNSRGSQNMVRKSLVVLQFSMSVIVLIALIVVQQQVSFLKNKDVGYDTHNLLSIGQVSWAGKGESFKNELLQNPNVEAASITSWLPTLGAGFMSSEIDDPNHAGNKLKVWYINGDVDLDKVMGLRLIKGRLLDKTYSADIFNPDSLMSISDSATYANAANQQSSLITAYTAKVLQVKDLGMPIRQAHTTPVGIIKDFNNESLKEPIKPTIIIAGPSPNYGGMLIKVKPGQEKKVAVSVSKLWRQFYPNKLLEIKWVDDMLAAQYKTESRLQQLFSFFSGLSMFLAALGVLGLIIQATAQRKKEIGVRKVLGASVTSIVRLFSIDFVKLVLIAVLIASPVAWWLMNKWLLDFAYRIHISGWVFIIAGAIAVIIALLTISIQSIKAAMANPIKSLRTE
ncbi:FtsX-like permease family protein [Parafilimonas terrae]|uniref:Putative ABC transport system permease protein n=1 Tax=Parafilimonas terrae TaxID=1465490 RepID=A0A1I5VR76_9BACT|nr:FtsX-like permease family protein [Parafilimonas terrae]SFQ09913.1 putative ABC transport system permease protein [Parafilimonas terrae]